MIHSSCAILLGRFAPGTETTPHLTPANLLPDALSGYDAPKNLADISVRVRRLERLSIWQECNDPLLYVERRAFLTAMPDSHIGIESARVALAQSKQRPTPK